MISIPKIEKHEIIIKKIRQNRETTHLCKKQDESFRLEILIPRQVGALSVTAHFENGSSTAKWHGIEKGSDIFSIDFSKNINSDYFHTSFSLSIHTHFEVWYPDTTEHTLVLSRSKFMMTQNKNKSHKFILTEEKDATKEISGAIYHIFVDRFKKVSPSVRSDSKYNDDFENGIPEFPEKDGDFFENNTHFGGNFKGIASKLDYLKSINVDAIYLSPINKAFSNHKYDVGSYYEIDENFGGKNDFAILVRESHEKGIKIILDCVFNHTGDNSLYFNKFGNWDSLGAFQSKSSPYYNWYTFKSFPQEYDSWWGIKCLPSIKKGCREFIEYICKEGGVIDFLFSLGIDGVRLDVADELTLEFIKEINRAVKRNKEDALVIGEVWENATRKQAWGEEKFYFDKGKLDSVTNYPLMRGILEYVKSKNDKILLNVCAQIYTDYPESASLSLMNIISTHDTVRALTEFSEVKGLTKAEKANYKLPIPIHKECIEKMKMASLLQILLPGIPCIYYGDEIGMEGFEDPFNRMPMKWHNKNDELLSWYKKIMNIRKNNRPFYKGGLEIAYSDRGLFIFDRIYKNERIRTAVNLSPNKVTFNSSGEELILERVVEKATVKPYGCTVLRLS